MPTRIFLTLILSVLAAAALTVWIATSFSAAAITPWALVVPVTLAVVVRLIWMRRDG